MPAKNNPLLRDWTTPHGIPPFGDIEVGNFREAFEAALAAQRAEIDAIAANPAPPSFENTIDALEGAGRTLRQVSSVFFNLNGADTNDALQEIAREIAPVLARHRSETLLNAPLFKRIASLAEAAATLNLTADQARVLERYHTMFVRAGAELDDDARSRVREITERLAVLGTQFAQNVLADESGYELVLDGDAELAGLPEFLQSAADEAANDRGHPGKHAITLSRSSIEPFLQFSDRRDLRELSFNAWTHRGESGGETDNREIVAETVALRAERAKLLGFENYAAFKTQDCMAKTPDAVRDLLMQVWAPARERAETECGKLQAMVRQEGGNFEIAPWDWRYYAEKVRKAEHDIGESEIKPYLQLDRMIAAAFDTARQLFGLNVAEIEGMPVYHPDVRVFEVAGTDGAHVGIFMGDYFARPSKRSGAWMSAFRRQEKLRDDIRPIIVNVMNFSTAPAGEPTLLTFDDARTLFHEFGHALHGLLSDVTYPMISGTSVDRDFVELPSQLYEHWLSQPEVLRRYAIHYQTGEPMPESLLQRLLAAENFNQGFAMVEYVASALVDLEMHLLNETDDLDVSAFEQHVLETTDMPAEIVMRHRVPHFAHAFAGEGDSAGYYSYMWAELMDADAFNAFEEAGDAFDPETAARLAKYVYSAGGRQDAGDAYRAFRGRMPKIDALLEKRSLRDAEEI